MQEIDQIDENEPLTKSKNRQPIVQPTTQPMHQDIPQQIQQDVPVKSKRKITKPKSQKQLEAFERTRLIRLAKIDKLNKEKELYYAKLLDDHNKTKVTKPPIKQKQQQIIYQEDSSESDDSDDQPEIVYVKKPKTIKKKKTKIIVESESETSSSEEEQPVRVSRNTKPYQQPYKQRVTFDADDYFA